MVAGGADSVEVFAAVVREVAHVLSLPLVEMPSYGPDGTTTAIWRLKPAGVFVLQRQTQATRCP